MHFVDQVYLETTAARRILHVLEQLPCVFDFSAGCGIHFDQVEKATFIDFQAGTAFTAGFGGHPFLTIEAGARIRAMGGFAQPRVPVTGKHGEDGYYRGR